MNIYYFRSVIRFLIGLSELFAIFGYTRVTGNALSLRTELRNSYFALGYRYRYRRVFIDTHLCIVLRHVAVVGRRVWAKPLARSQLVYEIATGSNVARETV